MATKELVVTAANWSGVTVTTAEGDRLISWDDLRAAASQASEPTTANHRGIADRPNGELDLAAVYQRLLGQARRIAARGPVRVEVTSLTGGATWVVWCVTAAGEYDRSLMLVDEGGSHPHRRLAELEAEEIRDRLRKSGRLVG